MGKDRLRWVADHLRLQLVTIWLDPTCKENLRLSTWRHHQNLDYSMVFLYFLVCKW